MSRAINQHFADGIVAFASRQLRVATGLIGTIGLTIWILKETGEFYRTSLFGFVLGLSLLYGVQLRGLLRADGSVSWTGALASSTAWIAGAGFILYGWPTTLKIFDAFVTPLALIYIAAKLGCHRIGCCGWKTSLRKRRFPSLPLLEVVFTALLAISICLLSLTLDLEDGIACTLFMALHIAGWKFLQKFRNPKKYY